MTEVRVIEEKRGELRERRGGEGREKRGELRKEDRGKRGERREEKGRERGDNSMMNSFHNIFFVCVCRQCELFRLCIRR